MRAIKGSLGRSPKERHRGGSPWLHSDVKTTMMYIHVLNSAAWQAFAVRWMDFEPPYGGVVMRIRIRYRANYQKNCN